MARGRMLNQSYAEDKLLSELMDESGGDVVAIYFGLIPFQDREGRMHGDPCVLKGRCWPRAKRITPDLIEGALRTLHDKQLLIWYEAEDEKWICFPNFRKNQSKAQLDREAPSSIPEPQPQLLDQWRKPRMEVLAAPASNRMQLHADDTQTHAEWNGMEEKRTERKGDEPIAAVSDLEQSLSSWRWPIQIRQAERARAHRILKASPIQAHEIAEHRPKAEQKPAYKRLAYFLGAVEGSREDAARESSKLSPPSARAPPRPLSQIPFEDQRHPED